MFWVEYELMDLEKYVYNMHMEKYMNYPKHRFNLVIPKEFWDRIVNLAKKNRRSVTQEIIIAILDHLGRNNA